MSATKDDDTRRGNKVSIPRHCWEVAKRLDEKARWRFLDSVMGYAFDGVVPEEDGTRGICAFFVVEPTLRGAGKTRRAL